MWLCDRPFGSRLTHRYIIIKLFNYALRLMLTILFCPLSLHSGLLVHPQRNEKDRGRRRFHRTICRYILSLRHYNYFYWSITVSPVFTVVCLSARFPPQADQNCPSLRHHDQQLRVWKSLFPKIQPGKEPQATANHQHFVVISIQSKPDDRYS